MVIDKRDILATSVRNVEELKRRYDLDKENEKAEPVDLSEYVKNDVFPISIANGGTGANNRASAVKNLYAYDLIGQTVIPANADLNTLTYCACGTYYQGSNATVNTFANCPTMNAFRMTVKSVNNGISVSTSAWSMMRVREIETYMGERYTQHLFVGGTAGTIVYGAWQQVLTDEIGMLKPTLLWTNASPTSTFAAQTISLDLSTYNYVYIENCYASGASNYLYRRTELFPKNCTGTMLNASYFTWLSSRRATIDDSGITFSNGKYAYVGATGQGESANYCIPLKIYGVNI